MSRFELRAPGVLQEDFDDIIKRLRDGQIFLAIKDNVQRQNILKRLGRFPYVILSLYSLRRDFMYFRLGAKVMQRLFKGFGKRFKGIIRKAAEDAFSGINYRKNWFKLQTSEFSDKFCFGNFTDEIECGFRQLYLYALRNAFSLTVDCPLKEDEELTPVPTGPDPESWYRIGKLVYKLGFKSPEIYKLRRLNPDEEKVRDLLFKGRPPNRYRYDMGDFQKFISRIVRMFESAEKISRPYSNPFMVVVDGPGVPVDRRCGRQYSRAYKNDRDFMFFDVFNERFTGKGSGITSLFVRKSVYIAFFG